MNRTRFCYVRIAYEATGGNQLAMPRFPANYSCYLSHGPVSWARVAPIGHPRARMTDLRLPQQRLLSPVICSICSITSNWVGGGATSCEWQWGMHYGHACVPTCIQIGWRSLLRAPLRAFDSLRHNDLRNHSFSPILNCALHSTIGVSSKSCWLHGSVGAETRN